ncbi:MAG: Gfo/Idh/MocA family oxidoreductase [Bifidobacteriaceae bacterium]|jgi:predicted dehydrogenase|nr:Gfo/Idh/MocA family oxidoreductase [Bifidobacteriaceae bacterium]
MSATKGIGIIGTGNIFGQYFDTIAKLDWADLLAVADADQARAEAVGQERGVPATSIDGLLADPAIDLVINLTPPAAHVEVDRRIIAAGKHVQSEKPLALSLEEGKALLAEAGQAGVQVGCAPDTFLGTGLQTTIKTIQDGRIGTPFAAAALWGGPGPEPWHPNPQFFYLPGGGPILDMGPYYVTALVAHLGPVKSVLARNLASDRQRVVGSGPLKGTPLKVETPTYAAAILEHYSGALSTVTLSFETWASGNQLLEIYGTAGTLQLPDPNWFSLKGRIFEAEGPGEWVELEDAAGFVDSGRGIGAVELLRAVDVGRTPRTSGLLALHVAEILFAINTAQPGDGPIAMTTKPEVPAVVPLGADVATV